MELKKSKRLKFTGLWIVMLSLFLGELFFYTWCRVNNVNLGYEVAQETEKKTKLIAYQENLKIELARLKSPERIEKIAREQLGLVRPKPEQIIIVE